MGVVGSTEADRKTLKATALRHFEGKNLKDDDQLKDCLTPWLGYLMESMALACDSPELKIGRAAVERRHINGPLGDASVKAGEFCRQAHAARRAGRETGAIPPNFGGAAGPAAGRRGDPS